MDSPAAAERPASQRLALVAIVVCALAALFWPRGEGSFEAPGGFLVDGGGRPTPLATRLAPVSLVHFWATWCAPCLTEVPALVRLEDELAGGDRFRVVMIAVDDTAEDVGAFLGGTHGEVLYDPNWEVAHRYGTRQLPETYLVIGGRVVRKFAGATDWDDDRVRAALQEAMATRGARRDT